MLDIHVPKLAVLGPQSAILVWVFSFSACTRTFYPYLYSEASSVLVRYYE